jgi:hypothetical protein
MRTITLLALLTIAHASASAQTSATVDQFANSFLALTRGQCAKLDPEIKQLEAAGNTLEAHTKREAFRGICECAPTRMKELQSSLTKEQLGEVMSEARFTEELFKPRVLGPCIAKQFQAGFDEGCPARLAAQKKDSEAYCSCMALSLKKFTEAEVVQLSLEMSDYIPAAADAKKRGVAEPERPALFRRFMSMDESCTDP